jgi:hypothetical protein
MNWGKFIKIHLTVLVNSTRFRRVPFGTVSAGRRMGVCCCPIRPVNL